MKIKIFEDFKLHDDADIDYSDYDKSSYWAYSDNFIKIHKILNGVNKGKIQFRFFDENASHGQYFSYKCSMMFGVAKLLDTKYANLPEIRDITIGSIKFRKTHSNTIEHILKLFTKIDFSCYNNPDDKDKSLIKRIISSSSILKFGDNIKEISLTAQNLGDIFDKLKILRDEVYEYQKELLERYIIELDTKKYNL